MVNGSITLVEARELRELIAGADYTDERALVKIFVMERIDQIIRNLDSTLPNTY